MRVSTILIRIVDVARILLFNQLWEVRHGASLILRALARKAESFPYFNHMSSPNEFKKQRGASIKKLRSTIDKQGKTLMRDFLNDCIIRNLLIIGLDRFSDYVDDDSNIIVRKISSQAISLSLKFLKNQQAIITMIEFFQELQKHPKSENYGWEPKQGSIFLLTDLLDKIPSLSQPFAKSFNSLILTM